MMLFINAALQRGAPAVANASPYCLTDALG